MAKKELPNPMKKRELLYSTELPAEEKVKLGRQYLEAGCVSDAVAFFLEGASEEALAEMRDMAMREGDAFNLRAIEKVLPELVNEDHWKGLAETAGNLGKEAFRAQAEDGGKVEMPVVDAVIQEDPTQHVGDGEAEDGGAEGEQEEEEAG